MNLCLILCVLLTVAHLCFAQTAPQPSPVSPYPPVPPQQRLVGMAYTTWHLAPGLPDRPGEPSWNKDRTWGTPLLGAYASDDRHIIRQHALWLADAGVNFIWIDWSNNIRYTYDPRVKNPTFDMIEGATTAIFDEYAAMRAEGLKTPNISIFAGVTGAPEAAADGRLQRKADQIYKQYVENPRYRLLLQTYQGKPLLVIYVNTPSPFQNGVPAWTDPRFTVRWMTGYVTEQSRLRTPDLVSKYGYWSWEDRGPQTYTVHDGSPEAMVVVASYRPQGHLGDKHYIPAAPRDNGKTFRREWARADTIGPKFAMVVSWNEWSRGEQPSPEVSKDIEPSQEFGRFYLDLLKEQIAQFKSRDKKQR